MRPGVVRAPSDGVELPERRAERLLRARAGKAEVHPLGKGAKEYRRLLAQATGDLVALSALDRELAEPHAASAPPAPHALADPDASVAGDDVAMDAPMAALQDGEGNHADDGGSVAGSAVEPAGPPPPLGQRHEGVPVDLFPDHLLGQRLRRVKGKHGGGWNYQPRLSISCTNATHERCNKSRSVELDVAKYGPRAALYFIGAWLSRAEAMTAEQHRRWVPDAESIRSFKGVYEGAS